MAKKGRVIWGKGVRKTRKKNLTKKNVPSIEPTRTELIGIFIGLNSSSGASATASAEPPLEARAFFCLRAQQTMHPLIYRGKWGK